MDEFNNAKALINDADAVLISASNGLSISEGYNIFAEDEAFKKHFARFTKLYGIHNILQGALGKLPEDAHNEFIMELQKYLVEEYTPTKAFASLKKLISNHDYFILTSNADTHFQLNDFAADKIWEIEGNFFDNEQNSPDWKYQQQNYQEFMKKYAAKKVVQLELGIGKQNQMLKAPLMAIVGQLPTWSYVTLNLPNKLMVNSAIKNRSVAIGGDITTNLTKLAEAEPNSNFIEEMQNQKRQFDYEDLVMKTQMNYSNYYSVYAQGGTAEPLSDKAPLPYDEQIKVMAQKIKEADHIIVGGASGLSAAGGGDFYYTDSPSFYKYFGKFAKKYGFKGAFAGMRYQWQSREEFWGYLATFLHTTQHAPLRSPYRDLQKLLKGKDYFILTTNQDTQAIKAFPENKVAEIQGDHRYFQCSQQCTDEIWDAVKPVEEMVKAMGDGTAVPTELIPHCQHCGAEAFPWVRGYGNFLEGSKYHEEYGKVTDYLKKNMNDGKVLFLELGVSRMTPMFIQEPFWELTAQLPNAYDVMVNRDYQFLPKKIADKGLAIKDDIAKVLDDVVTELEK